MNSIKNKTLVVGASTTQSRYSNVAIKRLIDSDFEVEAIGKKEGFIKGVKINTSKNDFEDIDTVSIYLNPKNQEPYYDYIIGLKPRRVIFNPGTENETFETLLNTNDIDSERSCTIVLLSLGEY